MNPRSHQATFRWNSGSFWANLVQHSADAMRGKLARCEVLRNGEGSTRRARSQDGRGTAIRCEPSALSFGVRRRRWRPRDWNPVPPHTLPTYTGGYDGERNSSFAAGHTDSDHHSPY